MLAPYRAVAAATGGRFGAAFGRSVGENRSDPIAGAASLTDRVPYATRVPSWAFRVWNSPLIAPS